MAHEPPVTDSELAEAAEWVDGCLADGESLVRPFRLSHELPHGFAEACGLAKRSAQTYLTGWYRSGAGRPEVLRAARAPGRVNVFAPSLTRGASGDPRRADEESVAQWLQALLHLSLYADCVWVPDPLEILARRVIGGESGGLLSVHEPVITAPIPVLIKAYEGICALRPLFEQGALALYPAVLLYELAVSTDLFGTTRSFTGDELERAWPDLFVAEGVSFARHLGANYTPLSPDELLALEVADTKLSQATRTTSGSLVTMLPYLTLPYFRGLTPRQLAAVRGNNEYFEGFRSKLRVLSRQFSTSHTDADYLRDLREFEDHVLAPAFNALTTEVARTKSLTAALTDVGVNFAAGAIFQTLFAGHFDQAAALAGASTGLVALLVKIFSNQTKASPAALGVYHLAVPGLLNRPVGRHWSP